MLPRLVAFNDQGIAVAAGCPANTAIATGQATTSKVMFLPGDNPEFIEYDVRGKTEHQILADLPCANRPERYKQLSPKDQLVAILFALDGVLSCVESGVYASAEVLGKTRQYLDDLRYLRRYLPDRW